ncbi:MAG: DoxX family protein [Lutibacter sp.]|nr:DoxX family protein [Lutibacter sp.]
MKALNTFTSSLENKTTTAYALIRIFLGLVLAIRGWLILANPNSVIELGVSREYFIYVSLIGIVHLVGGALLFLGFFSRIGAFVQLPILFSAVFFVHEHTQLMMGGQSLELAILVLFLLCIYAVFGAGSLTIKDFKSKNKLAI